MSVGDSLLVDRHPEKRLKASFKAYEEAEMPRLKEEKPVHYGDGGDEEDAELEELYDYSSSYANEGENQMVVAGESANTKPPPSSQKRIVNSLAMRYKEHGFGNGAVKGGYSEDEGDERDEQKRS
ncbi:hypothetical protein Rs2_02731 [Raphanus sativus]|nr:hypothetical protein Rs2_02731 [Raphanus sativus]